MLIDIDVISLARLSAIVAHVVILPKHLTLIAINAHQISITGSDQQLTTPLCETLNPELLGELILTIAVFNQRQFLAPGMIAVQTFVVGLYPYSLLRIDVETVDTTLDAPLTKDRGRITGDLLGNRIEETEVHALLQPQIAINILPNLIDIVVTQRGRIIRIGIEGTETVTVIAVQTIGRTNPDITFGVLEQIVNRGVRQAIARVKATEFHIGNQRSSCTNGQTASDKQR